MESSLYLANSVSGHASLVQLWSALKPELDRHPHVVEVRPYEDKLSDQQRRYYHGHILTEIARQARPDGKQYPMSVWKEFFRDRFLGTKRKACVNPITGRKSKRNVRVSTEDLGVRGYANLIERVTAFAVTDLGVNFDMTLQDFIDDETGEIVRRAA